MPQAPLPISFSSSYSAAAVGYVFWLLRRQRAASIKVLGGKSIPVQAAVYLAIHVVKQCLPVALCSIKICMRLRSAHLSAGALRSERALLKLFGACTLHLGQAL